MRTYMVNEVFYSLQGEGVRAGTANVFVRFTACNLECRMEPGPKSPGGFDCDTAFTGGRKFTLDDLIDEAVDAIWLRGRGVEAAEPLERDRASGHFVLPAPFHGRVGVICTGGEPALQLDSLLVSHFHHAGFFPCAIETNGTVDVSDLDLDWICVSPKVAEHALRQRTADEVKYVLHAGQALPKTQVIARSHGRPLHKLISPAFGPEGVDRAALAWCVRLCKEHPEWHLSMQQHKTWGVR